MTLIQKSINGTEYYTDDTVYYTFHEVKAAQDTLWSFACTELGITRETGFFTSQETKNITDLAGIGSLHPTQFLLLRNGDAIPVPYLNGSSDLHLNDIILRSAVAPAVGEPIIPPVPTVVPSSVLSKSVADRLKEVDELHDRKLLTDPEYQEKRTKLIAEL